MNFYNMKFLIIKFMLLFDNGQKKLSENSINFIIPNFNFHNSILVFIKRN